MNEVSDEYLKELIVELFNKLIKLPVLKIQDNKIYYNFFEKGEVTLEAFKRTEKKESTKLFDLDRLARTFPFYWQVFSGNSELLDFYITVNGKQYFVPRPDDLEVYARTCKILNNKIKTYEIELFKSLIHG